jgi:hypothetical protein
MSDFKGFPIPEQNYSKLPHVFIDMLPSFDSMAELKVMLYILRHTWGFSEFDKPKKITTDEFMNGRKKKDRSRMDAGTGLSSNSVVTGLLSAVNHGYINVEIDNKDKARIKKSYILNMAISYANVEEPDSEVEELDSDSEERSEKETYRKKLNRKNEEEEVAPNKLKSSLLLSKITKLFDPIDYGTITIKPEFRKLPASIVLGHIAKAYHDRKGLSQPIGYLTSLLNKNEQPDPFYMAEFRRVLPADYLEAVGMGEYICAECEKVFKTAAKLEQHTNYMHPEPEPVEVKPLEDSEVSKTWQSVLAQLQMEMPRASFDTWVRDTLPVSFGDGILTVGAQTQYACDWLENRLASTVNRLLVGIMNTDVIQVQFVAVQA